ncbi:MAG: hypothetical protein ABWZ25_05760 [Chitinophagaceae bacterium]
MKKTILLLLVVMIGLNLFSQTEPTLKIKTCSKKFTDRSLPVDSIQQIRFTEHDLRKGKLKFSYRNGDGDASVKRTIMIEDSTGKQLYSADASSFKIKSRVLREMLRTSTLRVYTMAIPSDPEKAKLVRVRRYQVAEFLY